MAKYSVLNCPSDNTCVWCWSGKVNSSVVCYGVQTCSPDSRRVWSRWGVMQCGLVVCVVL